MAVKVCSREELHCYLADSLSLVMVRESGLGLSLFLSFYDEVVLCQYEFKKGLPSFSLVYDVTALVILGSQARFVRLDRYPAPFGRDYRDVLDYLQRYDDSVTEVVGLVAGMTPAERETFLPFFLHTLIRRLAEWVEPGNTCEFEYFPENRPAVDADEYCTLRKGFKLLYVGMLQESMGSWLQNFQQARQPLFAEDDLFVFRYYVKLRDMFDSDNQEHARKLSTEELTRFLGILKQYGRLLAGFQPYDNKLIRAARKIRETLVPVEEQSLVACGGYAGLRPSGNLDRVESLLPTELAFVEENQAGPDLFDVHLIEDRLLFFTRDRHFSLRKKRCFHIIFWEADKMDYRSAHMPIRWPFIFLAIIFQMIGLFRDYFFLRYYPFQFVFGGSSSYGEEIGNLLCLLAARDFPDIRITSEVVGNDGLEPYFSREIKGGRGDHTCLIFGRRQEVVNARLPEGYQDLHQVRVFFEGHEDSANIDCGIIGCAPFSQILTDTSNTWQTLHRLRDHLTLEVIGGRQGGR